MFRLLQMWAALRSSLWFLPALMAACAVALAAGLIELDTRVARELLAEWPRLFGAGADGARGMLTAIASSMITVAGVTFSITIVALSLAATQYTPRVLRNFMGDRTNQLVLGFFVGIFAYCLVVLRTIRGGDEGQFVPSISVAFGFVLALAGVGVLILFIHHIATSIQASHLIAAVARETVEAVGHLFPEELGEGADEDETLAPVGSLAGEAVWTPRPSPRTGYVQGVDADALLRLSRETGAVVRMEAGVGEFVVEGSPLVSLSTGNAAEAPEEVLSIGPNRTVEQDASFGINQIVDIALKALSPGINDTTTAVTCVDYLTAVLAALAPRRIESRYRVEGGILRVIAKGPTFEGLVADSFDHIRQNAGGNVAVIERLLRAVEELARRTRSPRRRAVLAGHARLFAETAERTVESEHDRRRLRSPYGRALAALGAGGEGDVAGAAGGGGTR